MFTGKVKALMHIHHCIATFFMISIEMKLLLGGMVSQIEPSRVGFNILWEA